MSLIFTNIAIQNNYYTMSRKEKEREELRLEVANRIEFRRKSLDWLAKEVCGVGKSTLRKVIHPIEGGVSIPMLQMINNKLKESQDKL